MEETQSTRPRKKSAFTARNVILVLVILLFIAIGAGVFFYQKANGNPQQQSQQELKQTVAAVGKLMVLPDETPTLATVSDPEKLKDQAFFKNAHTGDKVLIYANAQKAILYSPSLNKIVEVAPVNLGGK